MSQVMNGRAAVSRGALRHGTHGAASEKLTVTVLNVVFLSLAQLERRRPGNFLGRLRSQGFSLFFFSPISMK